MDLVPIFLVTDRCGRSVLCRESRRRSDGTAISVTGRGDTTEAAAITGSPFPETVPATFRAGIIGAHERHSEREVEAMARPETRKPEAKTTSGRKAAPVSDAAMNKAATRAAAASTKLENRELPAGYVRSEGVKILLAEREARKR